MGHGHLLVIQPLMGFMLLSLPAVEIENTETNERETKDDTKSQSCLCAT